MAEQTQTPTPWRAEDDRVVFGVGLLVAECYGDSTIESCANADFIVKAVNNHGPMTTLLRRVAEHARLPPKLEEDIAKFLEALPES
ncbi:MAG TPA: hypothetical protein VFX37_08060 [Pseudolabrys sp.]|nr:hypothetical protein [Pseudolabrys sp.]